MLCDIGYDCNNGTCVLVNVDPCDTVQCEYGYSCQNGTCILPPDLCSLVVCEYGSHCENGTCKADYINPDLCANIACGSGYVCRNGSCYRGEERDLCENVICASGYTCRRGKCETSTTTTIITELPITINLNFDFRLRQWIVQNPEIFNQWKEEVNELYDSNNGYYVNPNPVPHTYLPPNHSDPCFEGDYTPTGYCITGYDRNGYDKNGFTESGYDLAGWSRFGRDAGTEFNALGTFRNPDLSHLHAAFYANGTVRTYQNQILTYDIYGYDQFNKDVNGNDRPGYGKCQPRTPTPPTPPGPSPNPIPPTGGCESTSERPSGNKYIYIRKSTTSMTPSDWARFRAVWHQLNNMGKIGEYTVIHRQQLNQHNDPKFLPWHREFLARFENDMHLLDPCVFLPYWDAVSSPQFPIGISEGISPNFPPPARFMDGGAVFTTDSVERSIGTRPLESPGFMITTMSEPTWSVASQRFEHYHNFMHSFVGGDMTNAATSTIDPAFWLVHCYIDRQWDQWQRLHPNEPSVEQAIALNPLRFMSGADQTFENIRHIETVSTSRGDGYRYI